MYSYMLTFIDKLCVDFNYMQNSTTKLGFWGTRDGSEVDTAEAPFRLKSVTIMNSSSINSIEFSYTDRTGKLCKAGPWGGSGGTAQKVYDVYNCLDVQQM